MRWISKRSSMVYNIFDKKSASVSVENMLDEELAEELHKPIIRKFRKRKMHSSFNGNIWDADLTDMQLVSKVFYYLLLTFLVNMNGLFL